MQACTQYIGTSSQLPPQTADRGLPWRSQKFSADSRNPSSDFSVLYSRLYFYLLNGLWL